MHLLGCMHNRAIELRSALRPCGNSIWGPYAVGLGTVSAQHLFQSLVLPFELLGLLSVIRATQVKLDSAE